MKPIKLLIPVILIFSCACQSDRRSPKDEKSADDFNFEKEKQAILDVIQKESTAFWNKDFESYASCWVHADYTRSEGWWKQGGISVVEGWKTNAENTKKMMKESPDPNPTASRVRRKNINIRIYNDVAWLTFDQYGEDTGDPSMDMPGRSRETRILEKHDGQWKIVYVCWLLEDRTPETE